ncbi:conserved protein of unknown function [Paenibacillus alvei]|uniref:Uncharacterized protein n=1 Tax=Paenibacillus alvei TaxID=44250 RepID=A0A383RI66_PAEAL|nr:conserved protein of unknown function [Paenibacillus alvei]
MVFTYEHEICTWICFYLISWNDVHVERAASQIAGYLELSGFLAGGKTGNVPIPKTAGFFDNLFIPLFLIIGIVLLILGRYKRK